MKSAAEQLREEKRFMTKYKIFKAASRAFDFMYGMANDLEDATTSLSPYSRTNLACSKTELELLELQLYYHKVANEIGKCWTEAENNG